LGNNIQYGWTALCKTGKKLLRSRQKYFIKSGNLKQNPMKNTNLYSFSRIQLFGLCRSPLPATIRTKFPVLFTNVHLYIKTQDAGYCTRISKILSHLLPLIGSIDSIAFQGHELLILSNTGLITHKLELVKILIFLQIKTCVCVSITQGSKWPIILKCWKAC
jgi:hypothetical protein